MQARDRVKPLEGRERSHQRRIKRALCTKPESVKTSRNSSIHDCFCEHQFKLAIQYHLKIEI